MFTELMATPRVAPFNVPRDLSSMPEALRRLHAPELDDEVQPPELIADAGPPIPYQGNRTINPRSRGACRLFSVLPDLPTGRPRVYGVDSQLEQHHLALVLTDTSVEQVQEQFGPIPFRDENGKLQNHYFDLVARYKSGHVVATAVKPTERLKSGRFIRELKQLKASEQCAQFDEIRLVTENCFKRSEATNALAYLKFRLFPDWDVHSRLNEVIPTLRGILAIHDLMKLLKMGGRSYRSIYRAIFEGKLEKVSPGKINEFTLIRAAA